LSEKKIKFDNMLKDGNLKYLFLHSTPSTKTCKVPSFLADELRAIGYSRAENLTNIYQQVFTWDGND
jgi:hypothetical protein